MPIRFLDDLSVDASALFTQNVTATEIKANTFHGDGRHLTNVISALGTLSANFLVASERGVIDELKQTVILQQQQFNTFNQIIQNWEKPPQTVQTLSARWELAYDILVDRKDDWDLTTSLFSAASAVISTFNSNVSAAAAVISKVQQSSAYWDSTNLTVNSLSSNWDKTYTTVNRFSSTWIANTLVNELSANWNAAYNTTNSLSSNWDSTHSTITFLSGSWNSGYSTTNSLSSNWNSVHSTITVLSGSWNSGYSSVNSLSSNWNSNYSTTNSLSGNWNSCFTLVSSLSSNWDLGYTLSKEISAKIEILNLNLLNRTPVGGGAGSIGNIASNLITLNTIIESGLNGGDF
jgi:hypothetical protein